MEGPNKIGKPRKEWLDDVEQRCNIHRFYDTVRASKDRKLCQANVGAALNIIAQQAAVHRLPESERTENDHLI